MYVCVFVERGNYHTRDTSGIENSLLTMMMTRIKTKSLVHQVKMILKMDKHPKKMMAVIMFCLLRSHTSEAFNNGLVSGGCPGKSRCTITGLPARASDSTSDPKIPIFKRSGFGAWVKSRKVALKGRLPHTQHDSRSSAVAGMSGIEQHSATQLSSSVADSLDAEPQFNGIIHTELIMTVLDEWYMSRAKEIVGSSTIPLEVLDLFVWYFKRLSASTAQHVSNDVKVLKNTFDVEIIPAIHRLSWSNPQSHSIDLMESHIEFNAARPTIVPLEDNSFQDLEDSNIRSIIEGNVYKRLTRWSTHMRNVTVKARLHDHFLSRAIFRGEVCSDVRVEFDRLTFPNLKISAGGRIDVNGCAMSLLSIAPHIGQIYPGKRYVQPFEFHAKGCILTQDDILESSCIQNGLQNLLNLILSSRVVRYAYSSAKVVTVQIMDSQISCKGFAHTSNGVKVPFEVRSGLSVSSDGHILTFPGLSVALDPFLKVFMPVLPAIDVDIGANAKIEELKIIDKRNLVQVSARAVVSPERAMRLLTYRSRIASPARFRVDLGDFVTTLGKFHE